MIAPPGPPPDVADTIATRSPLLAERIAEDFAERIAEDLARLASEHQGVRWRAARAVARECLGRLDLYTADERAFLRDLLEAREAPLSPGRAATAALHGFARRLLAAPPAPPPPVSPLSERLP